MNIGLNQFVKHECCNYVSDVCMGVDFYGVGFNREKPCLVMKREKCRFFIKAVLPLANMDTRYIGVVGQYQDIDLAYKANKDRHCKCGNLVIKGKKFCARCRAKMRKKTNKAYNNSR